MAEKLPKSGEPLLVSEIFDLFAEDASSLQGKSIRVTGRLKMYNLHNSTATLSDPKSNKDLVVDTKLVEPFNARTGSLFQFIGELDCSADSSDLTLTARVIRCVDGIDLVMYQKSLEIQRQFLQQRS